MSSDGDYDGGRYNRPFSGGDWNAYRQGQADRDRWNQSRASATAKPAAGFSAPVTGGGGGDGSLLMLAAIVIGIVLAPLAAVLAAVATPILVALHRRRGESLRYRDILWPAAVTAFVIVAVHVAAYFLAASLKTLAAIIIVEATAALAAGYVLQRMGTYRTYQQAVIDAALAFLAPAMLCVGFIAAGTRLGAAYADIPLFLWLPALGIAAAVIAAQTGLAYGALARWVFRQPFGRAAVAGVMGAFVSIIVTGLIFYFFQPGEPFLRTVLGRGGEGGSIIGGFAWFVLLQIPGTALCSVVTGWNDAASAPQRMRLLTAGAVLAVVSNFWALGALTALADQWIAA